MIAFSQTAARVRGRIALAAVFTVLGLAVVWAHSGLVMDHSTMDPAATVCLAVIGAGAVLAVLPSGRSGRLGWLLRATPRRPSEPLVARTVGPPARAGPAELQVFLN
jgi:hypothetical protein